MFKATLSWSKYIKEKAIHFKKMYYVQYVTGKWFAFEKTFQVLPTTVYVSVLASEPTG